MRWDCGSCWPCLCWAWPRIGGEDLRLDKHLRIAFEFTTAPKKRGRFFPGFTNASRHTIEQPERRTSDYFRFALLSCRAEDGACRWQTIGSSDREAVRKTRVPVSRFDMVRIPVVVSVFLVFSLCNGCSTSGRTGNADAIAERLGYEGCKLSKPLTMAEVMGRDMSGGYEQSRPHPDWDELIRRYAAGDLIYFIDCRRMDPSRIVAGTSLYALVRNGVIIARALDMTHR